MRLAANPGSPLNPVGIAILALFSAISILAGVLLFEKSRRGITLSKWVQAVQVPIVILPAFGYQLAAGLTLGVLNTAEMIWLRFGWGGEFTLYLASGRETSVGVNLAPVLLFAYLQFCSRRKDAGTRSPEDEVGEEAGDPESTNDGSTHRG